MTSKLEINGYEIEVGPVSPLAPKAIEIQYRRKYPEPEPVTYEVESVGGLTETFEYDMESIEEATDEERKAFAAYVEALEEWQTGLTLKLLRLFLTQGVKLQLTDEQAQNFAAQIRVLELDVPENELERNLFFLETFILNTQDDMQRVIQAVMAETGIKEDAIEAANATFRD